MCVFFCPGHTLCARTCESWSLLARLLRDLFPPRSRILGSALVVDGCMRLTLGHWARQRLEELARLPLRHGCLPCLEGVEWPVPTVCSQSPPSVVKNICAPAAPTVLQNRRLWTHYLMTKIKQKILSKVHTDIKDVGGILTLKLNLFS